MRVLLIGGTRFIGPRVVRRLIEAGHEAAVFYRGVHEAALPVQVRRFKHVDATMPVVRIPEALRCYAPEVVVHMIAMGETDARAARVAFRGIARRVVVVSSGDVYRAYGIFKRTEDGKLEPMPLTEQSALRSKLFPYRTDTTPRDSLEYGYDKILAEQELSAATELPATILRLPKVYGPEDNAQLATVYEFRNHPDWRWTHGYVENVAAAIALATQDERAAGGVFNVGEPYTPSVAERLQYLPHKAEAGASRIDANFAQHLAYDTQKIRRCLGFVEEFEERAAMARVAANG